ncbi:MAG TPA: cytochrome c [Verrucomicrobiae bacterium]|jgi:mono/diheme cytochrome c family protein|nr:cytochrome c [Verrucomicrobiae bacterium]
MRYFFLAYALIVLGTVGLLGFRGEHSRKPPLEIFPDMVRQNKVRPQTPSELFPDQYASRVFPENTVPHSAPYMVNGQVLTNNGQPVYAYQDIPLNTGKIPGTTNFVDLNPLPITHQLLERGQQRFQINCLPCHGALGDGKGITSKYNMAPANFHDQRLVNMPDGEIFNTITYGKNLMGPYGANVTTEDRWAVVAYVRVLQRSQLASVEDVPEAKRSQFKK